MKDILDLLKRMIQNEAEIGQKPVDELSNPNEKLQKIFNKFNCSIIIKFVSTSDKRYIFLSNNQYAFSEDDWFFVNRSDNQLANDLIQLIPNQVREQMPRYPYQISLMREHQFIYLKMAFSQDWSDLTMEQASKSLLYQYLWNIYNDFEIRVEQLVDQSLYPKKEIHKLQYRLIGLVNEVELLLERIDSRQLARIKHYQLWINQMLFFLETDYFQYLDTSRVTSRHYKAWRLRHLKGKIDFIIRRLNSFGFVKTVLEKLMDDDENLDYHSLNYLIDLSEYLFDQVYPDMQEIKELKLIDTLAGFNFNSLRFSRFWYKSVLVDCNVLPDFKSKEAYLFEKITEIKQLDLVDNALNPVKPDVIEQVTGFLMKELEDQYRLNRILEQNQPDKVTVNLSVNTIGYILRISHQLNLFPHIKITNLIRKASTGISSYRQPEISFKSFRTKCYTVDNSVKNAVKGLLKRMVDHIDGEPL